MHLLPTLKNKLKKIKKIKIFSILPSGKESSVESEAPFD
jgi:hypothetical protein